MRHVIAVLAGLAVLVGCTSTPVDDRGNPTRPATSAEDEYDQVPRIQESFDRMRAAMIEGDTKTYFELLSSRQQQGCGGYDAFVRDYTANQNGWREMWRNADVRKIAIDERNKEIASVLVRWSTPGPHLVEFLLENGTWRLHYAVPE